MAAVGQAIYNFFFPTQVHSVRPGHRDRWGSRPAFIFACIGSAVGLGNIWRFPALSHKFGGGAFMLPYLLALFLVGIPILMLEFSLGQTFQSGDIISFGRVHKRLAGLGFASVIGAFLVVTYYTVIIAWSILYFLSSFDSTLPWVASNPKDSLTVAENFFFNDVLQVGDPSEGLETFRPNVYGAALFVWLVIFLCVFRGVSFTGNVVFISMPLPLILIAVLVVRGATLDGADIGIEAYIGQWDWSALNSGPIWSEAVSQIFFSIGICFGIMTAYSSYNHSYSNSVQDAWIIALSNSATSLLAGFAVFSILGHLSQTSGIAIDDLGSKGLGLAFITYPVALAQLPGSNFWCVLFFGTLFTLGLDSAFSLVEAVTTALKDSTNFRRYSHVAVTGAVTVLALTISVFYSFDNGLTALDSVDYYVNNILMVFVGLMECVAVGWVYDIEQQSGQIGQKSVFIFAASWVIGTITAAVLTATVTLSGGDIYSGALGVPIGAGIVLLGTILAYAYAEEPAEESKAYWLFLHNPEALRADLNTVVGHGDNTKIPFVWSLLMKYFLPQLLTSLLVINVDTLATDNGYEGYPVGYQILGILASCIPIVMCILAMAYPKCMEPWMRPETEDADEDVQLDNLGSSLGLMAKHSNHASMVVESEILVNAA